MSRAPGGRGPLAAAPGPAPLVRRPLRVGLVTPDPGHPLLAEAAALLAGGGASVEVLDPAAPRPPGTAADVYLLKSRTPQALELAHALEAEGARVVNSAAATERCQDRAVMAADALRAGLPFAATRRYASPAELAAGEAGNGPVVVKSRHSRKADTVVLLEDASALRDFAATAGQEPYVVQDFLPNSGWDHKLYAIGPHVFAGRRRSELAAPTAGTGPAPAPLPPAWRDLVRRTGAAFGLEVYGVDVVATPGGPVVVDVNAFPGLRGRPGAPEALAALVLRGAGGWTAAACGGPWA
ncbi:RimK family alpha-L-glutamate ligase [Streptomyces sp. NPDC020983]|uniref:RimK family alpha-L-glutamate ligase n=1 Tax=Streptomyces sp. NPDC020983 TaxID=3365106 RepID=UPI0037BB895E